MDLKKYNNLLVLADQKRTEYVPLSQIVYAETFKGITKLHIAQPASLITKNSLREVLMVIDDNSFMEINDSQFINKAFIKNINEQERLLTTSLEHKLLFLKKQLLKI